MATTMNKIELYALKIKDSYISDSGKTLYEVTASIAHTTTSRIEYTARGTLYHKPWTVDHNLLVETELKEGMIMINTNNSWNNDPQCDIDYEQEVDELPTPTGNIYWANESEYLISNNLRNEIISQFESEINTLMTEEI